jgi:hypothetical protein
MIYRTWDDCEEEEPGPQQLIVLQVVVPGKQRPHGRVRMERPDKGHRAYRVMENDDDEEEILKWVQCMMTMVLLMTDGVTVIDIINIKS